MTKRECALAALRGEKTDFVPCYFDSVQVVRAITSREAPPYGVNIGVDGWGVSQSACEEAAGTFTATVGVPPVINDITLWKEQAVFPEYNEEEFAIGAKKEQEIFKYDKKNFVQDLYAGKGLFERFHFMRGFEDALCDIVTDPDAVSDFVGAIADKKIEYLKLASKYYDIDYYTFLDDYAHQNGMFISLDAFRKIFKPHYQRIIDACHELGIKFKTHCCGKMEPLLDDFMEMGIDAIDPVQPFNNIIAMKIKTLGKIGISGGLDVQQVIDREGVTEEEIRAEVRRCIDEYSQGGGYMLYCASLNAYSADRLAYGKPLQIVCDEVEKYGGYIK